MVSYKIRCLICFCESGNLNELLEEISSFLATETIFLRMCYCYKHFFLLYAAFGLRNWPKYRFHLSSIGLISAKEYLRTKY